MPVGRILLCERDSPLGIPGTQGAVVFSRARMYVTKRVRRKPGKERDDVFQANLG